MFSIDFSFDKIIIREKHCIAHSSFIDVLLEIHCFCQTGIVYWKAWSSTIVIFIWIACTLQKQKQNKQINNQTNNQSNKRTKKKHLTQNLHKQLKWKTRYTNRKMWQDAKVSVGLGKRKHSCEGKLIWNRKLSRRPRRPRRSGKIIYTRKWNSYWLLYILPHIPKITFKCILFYHINAILMTTLTPFSLVTCFSLW